MSEARGKGWQARQSVQVSPLTRTILGIEAFGSSWAIDLPGTDKILDKHHVGFEFIAKQVDESSRTVVVEGSSGPGPEHKDSNSISTNYRTSADLSCASKDSEWIFCPCFLCQI